MKRLPLILLLIPLLVNAQFTDVYRRDTRTHAFDYALGYGRIVLQVDSAKLYQMIGIADSGYTIAQCLTESKIRFVGFVQSVTATSPVISSGGYTPNITVDTTILITRYDTAGFATLTEVNTRDTLVKQSLRTEYVNHDSVAKSTMRTWTINHDSVAKQGIRTEYIGHDTLVQQYARIRDALKVSKADSNTNGSYTSKKYVDGLILTKLSITDTANLATLTEVNTRDTLVKQYARGRFRTMSNHDSLSTLDEKSYNSLTDKPTSWAWSAVAGVPATYTPTAHNQAWSTITDQPATYAPSAHNQAWSTITDPPATYAPSAHNQAWTTIAGVPGTYTPTAHNQSWSTITDQPATYAPSAHTHNYVSSVSATLPISVAGTYTPTISISQAGETTDGYLSSTDWGLFISKQTHYPTLTYIGETNPTVGYLKYTGGLFTYTTPTPGELGAAATNHNHNGTYDNYSYWSLVCGGYNDPVYSGNNITFVNGASTTAVRYGPKAIQINNTAPDVPITWAASGTFTVTGTYPNFTGIGTGIGLDSLAFTKDETVVRLRDETDSVRIGTGSTDAIFDVNGSVSLIGGNGDLNNSGGVNSTDILLLQYYLSYKYQLTKSEIASGDIGAKGYLNFLDTELLGKIVSSEISLDSAWELSHWIRSTSLSYSVSGNVGIGTTIAPAEKLEVVGNALVSDTLTVGSTSTNVTVTDEDITAPNFKITPEGGYAIRLVSGDSLLQGDVVYVSEGVAYRPEAVETPIVGVVYANADVEESVWVVVSGIAYVRHFDPIYSGDCAYLDGENVEYVCNSTQCDVNLCGISTNVIPASVGTWIETDTNTGTSAKAKCIINIRHAIYESCP